MYISKEITGYIGIAVTIISFAPYYYYLFKNRVKPHAFSWLIWSLVTAIGYAAQQHEGAGPGSWTTLLSSVICFSIFFISLSKGERNITKSDWLTLIAALMAIPIWQITSNPLWSVIIVSFIDIIGYYPTIRKSYHKPWEESVFLPIVGGFKYIISIIALENTNLITVLYPASIIFANIFLSSMLFIRRMKK